MGPVPLTSLSKKERKVLRSLGRQILVHLGQGEIDEEGFVGRITYQARRPATDAEIKLSAWNPKGG